MEGSAGSCMTEQCVTVITPGTLVQCADHLTTGDHVASGPEPGLQHHLYPGCCMGTIILKNVRRLTDLTDNTQHLIG